MLLRSILRHAKEMVASQGRTNAKTLTGASTIHVEEKELANVKMVLRVTAASAEKGTRKCLLAAFTKSAWKLMSVNLRKETQPAQEMEVIMENALTAS